MCNGCIIETMVSDFGEFEMVRGRVCGTLDSKLGIIHVKLSRSAQNKRTMLFDTHIHL